MKLIEKIKIKDKREIKILNFPVIQYGKEYINSTEEKYFEIFSKSLEHKALDRILDSVGTQYDDYWIIRTFGLGETQLLNFLIDELAERNGTKKSCVVSSRGIYGSMFRMYNDIPFYFLDMSPVEYAPYLKKRNIFYRGKHFHVFHCTSEESLEWLNNHRQGCSTHIAEDILRWWDCDNYKVKTPQFSEEIKKSALDKVGNLNLEKFVFFVPESNGTAAMPASFWCDLAEELRRKGYDIFVNTTGNNTKIGKTAKLDIAEAVYIASLAKSIVALRCGYAELLAALNTRGFLHVLYTSYKPFNNPSSSFFRDVYTLEKYPFSNKSLIREYEVDNIEVEQLMYEIVEGL